MGDEDVRLVLLPTEAAFRIAGTIAMVLGAVIFVIFAIPVSGMLHVAGEPGGVLVGDERLWRRWVARMATDLTLCVIAVVIGWGLRRRRRWARWAWIVLGIIPLVALGISLGFQALRFHPEILEVGDGATVTEICLIALPASVVACWVACSQRCRVVFSLEYQELVAKTPKISAPRNLGRRLGIGLAIAMLMAFWAIMLLFLAILVICGVIFSI